MELLGRGPSFNPELEGLKIRWFSSWHPMLDEALAVLPEMETCPHELFGAIMRNPSPTAKRMGLVTRDGEPQGVVGLRRRRGCWEPAGQGVTPRAFVPCRPGMEYPVLAATRLTLKVNYWPGEIPAGRWIRDVEPYTVYTMPTDRRLEDHWRASHQWNVIKKARRRTCGMKFSVETAGDAVDRIVERWAEKWEGDRAQETLRAPDIALAGRYYQRAGQYVAATLTLDGELAAGTTYFLRDRVLVMQTHWTSADFRWHGSGTRIVDLLYEWAQEHGIRQIDLGGGGGYKSDVGIAESFRTNFAIAPPLRYTALRMGRQVKRVERLLDRMSREQGGSA